MYNISYGMRCAHFRKIYNNFFSALTHDKIKTVILLCISALPKIPRFFSHQLQSQKIPLNPVIPLQSQGLTEPNCQCIPLRTN